MLVRARERITKEERPREASGETHYYGPDGFSVTSLRRGGDKKRKQNRREKKRGETRVM